MSYIKQATISHTSTNTSVHSYGPSSPYMSPVLVETTVLSTSVYITTLAKPLERGSQSWRVEIECNSSQTE